MALSNLNQTHTGNALPVVAVTTPPGLTVNLVYNGFAEPPTNAGIYTVVATVSELNYVGSLTNIFVIAQEPTTMILTSANNPAGSLTVFQGESVDGVWTLYCANLGIGNGSTTLVSWGMNMTVIPVPEPSATQLGVLAIFLLRVASDKFKHQFKTWSKMDECLRIKPGGSVLL